MALLTGRNSLLIYTGRKDGLGNRVRALLSAQVLAEREDRDLYYVWSTDKYFGPAMDDLWEYDGGRSVPRLLSRALTPVHGFKQPGPTTITDAMRDEHLWQIRSHGQPVTWDEDMRDWTEDLRALRPVPRIADRINAVFDESLRGRPYVAVQVRSHAVSHAKTVETSPIEWFENRMREVRAEFPDVTFYLSCDTPEAQARLFAEFDNCVTLTDKGGYNTVEGVSSAITDLYLMGSAQHLIAPAYSSFPNTAIYLANWAIPFERPNEPLEGPMTLDLPLTPDPLRPSERG